MKKTPFIPQHFALVRGDNIVTTNPDGSIPLNAKFVCCINDDANLTLVERLLSQANAYATTGESAR